MVVIGLGEDAPVKVVDPVMRAKEIDEAARWLNEEETVEVVYGEFWEVLTPREGEGGRSYESHDFKLGCLSECGNLKSKRKYKLVNKWMFSEIVGKFQEVAAANKGKFPETLLYTRPVSNFTGRGRRGRRF